MCNALFFLAAPVGSNSLFRLMRQFALAVAVWAFLDDLIHMLKPRRVWIISKAGRAPTFVHCVFWWGSYKPSCVIQQKNCPWRDFAFNRRGVATHVCHDIGSMGSHGDLVLQLIDWLWIRLFLYAPSTAVPKLTKLAILALLTLNALPGTTQVGTVCIHLMGPSAHSQELWSNWHRIGLKMRSPRICLF